MSAVKQALSAMDSPASALATPSERPDEPLAAPQAAQRPTPNAAVMELRALARTYPYRDLIDFLARIEREQL